MKRIGLILCIILLTISISACGESSPTWQEQYDLGVRYLSEGNYEEAIIAFTAAIEIDSKRVDAYISRGDTYVVMSDEESLMSALLDYESVIELDPMLVDIYIKAAEIYKSFDKVDQAIALLERGLSLTKSSILQDELQPLTDPFRTQHFKSEDDLSLDVRNLVNTILREANEKDTAAVFDTILKMYLPMLKEGNLSNLRTEIDGYKVALWNSRDSETSQKMGFVEVRPENGEAHYYMAMEDQGKLVSTEIHGECVGWNWNGTFEKRTNYYKLDDARAWQYMTGKCVNGLLNGTIAETVTSGDKQSNWTTEYSMGKEQGRDYNFVVTIDGGTQVPEEWIW